MENVNKHSWEFFDMIKHKGRHYLVVRDGNLFTYEDVTDFLEWAYEDAIQ